SIKLTAERKVLRSKYARMRSPRQPQGTTGSQRIAKLPRGMTQVLLCGNVLGEVPPFRIARQNQLQLHLALLLCPAFCIATGQVDVAVVAHDLQQALVGRIYVFKLEIQHWIDPMLA